MGRIPDSVLLFARKRWAWEVVGASLCLIAVAGTWTWGERRTSRALSAQAASCEEWSRALAASEGRAAFRAFVAALHTELLAGRTDDVDAAVGGLLQLPGIAFVHVFKPDGSVVSSSDRKLMTTRKMGEEANWALGTGKLETRPGILPNTTEIAAPVQAAAGRMAIVWMGYRTEAIRAATRPAESR